MPKKTKEKTRKALEYDDVLGPEDFDDKKFFAAFKALEEDDQRVLLYGFCENLKEALTSYRETKETIEKTYFRSPEEAKEAICLLQNACYTGKQSKKVLDFYWLGYYMGVIDFLSTTAPCFTAPDEEEKKMGVSIRDELISHFRTLMEEDAKKDVHKA